MKEKAASRMDRDYHFAALKLLGSISEIFDLACIALPNSINWRKETGNNQGSALPFDRIGFSYFDFLFFFSSEDWKKRENDSARGTLFPLGVIRCASSLYSFLATRREPETCDMLSNITKPPLNPKRQAATVW